MSALYPAAGADPNPAELAKFMALVRQHENGGEYVWREDFNSSGHFGAYQIGRTEWLAWCAAAGVNPLDHSPEAQDKVAALQMSNYYRQFGSWELVAAAWFGGPGAAAKEKRNPGSVRGRGDGGTTIGAYMDFITAGMAGPMPAGAKGDIDIPGPIDIPTSLPGTDLVPGLSQLAALAEFTQLLLDPSSWLRLTMVIAGGGLVVIGAVLIVSDLPAVQKAAGAAIATKGI